MTWSRGRQGPCACARSSSAQGLGPPGHPGRQLFTGMERYADVDRDDDIHAHPADDIGGHVVEQAAVGQQAAVAHDRLEIAMVARRALASEPLPISTTVPASKSVATARKAIGRSSKSRGAAWGRPTGSAATRHSGRGRGSAPGAGRHADRARAAPDTGEGPPCACRTCARIPRRRRTPGPSRRQPRWPLLRRPFCPQHSRRTSPAHDGARDRIDGDPMFLEPFEHAYVRDPASGASAEGQPHAGPIHGLLSVCRGSGRRRRGRVQQEAEDERAVAVDSAKETARMDEYRENQAHVAIMPLAENQEGVRSTPCACGMGVGSVVVRSTFARRY